ncbi:MAG: hypothetical protein NZ550_01215 [Fimbriimonadales bacterium]|nr:hypothetical protein [Fimbriimonadales bacterium]MDW8051432.1 hypothetical protein [Armatimonadota bacterium]
MQRAAWVYREAKLIETGVYPDKGVVLTEAHLERLVRSFRAPVPLLVEHRPSPLVLGWLVRVWRRGGELFGTLALLPEADALLRRLRVRGLSVGLSRDLSQLLEVSITANPRIASAQLFHAAPHTTEVIRLEQATLQMPVQTPMRHDAEAPAELGAYHELLEARVRALEAELKRREAREQVQQWSMRGQIPPALAPLAEAILLYGDAPVQFSGETVPVSELFRRFVSSLPPRHLLTELAPVPEQETPQFSIEALEFLRRAFPDMDPAEILNSMKEVR